MRSGYTKTEENSNQYTSRGKNFRIVTFQADSPNANIKTITFTRNDNTNYTNPRVPVTSTSFKLKLEVNSVDTIFALLKEHPDECKAKKIEKSLPPPSGWRGVGVEVHYHPYTPRTSGSIHYFSQHPGLFGLNFQAESPDCWKHILVKMHATQCFNQSTLIGLFSLFKGAREKITLKDILALAPQFDTATLLAKVADKPSLLLCELGKHYLELSPPKEQEGVDCFRRAIELNPHDEYANQLMFSAYTKNFLKLKESESALMEMFNYSLYSGASAETQTADLYHQLCGLSDQDEKINGISGDAYTLIQLAQKIKQLKNAQTESTHRPHLFSPANPATQPQPSVQTVRPTFGRNYTE